MDKGDRVNEGQALAVVQDSELRYLADKARAELEERRKRADEAGSPVLQELTGKIASTGELLEIATREQRRVERAAQGESATESDFDKALNAVKTLESDLESLKAEKAMTRLQLKRELEVAESAERIAQWNLDQQTLRAPVSGVVLDRPVSMGTRLAVNDHVLQVADVRPESLVMRAQVDEEDVTRVFVDEARPQVVKMALYAFAGRTFEGRVVKVYDKADPDRRTFEVDIAVVAPDPKMSAGMTGELAFVVAERSRVKVVPSQAVQEGGLWTVRNGRLHKLDASVGVRGIDRAEVVSGPDLGDWIVVSPLGKLAEGRLVPHGTGRPQSRRRPEQAEGSGDIQGIQLRRLPVKDVMACPAYSVLCGWCAF